MSTDMDEKDLQMLLNQVGEIHRKAEQQRRDSGDRFNVFSVLRKSHEEVGLHSSFLHYLLDPKANHDQGPVFLHAFLEHAGLALSGDLSKVQAYREKDNVDVLLRSRTEAVVLENKIYASDQPQQLQRYHNTLRGKGVEESKITLAYLTLDGHEPKDKGGLDPDQLVLLSYADHILPWLDACLRLLASKPRIRETLAQYQDIVRRLTGQMGTRAEIDAVAKLLLQDNNYAKAQLIQQAMVAARLEVHHWFWPTLEQQLCQRGYELYRPFTRYDTKAYKLFLKQKKGGKPRVAFKLGVYERLDLIVVVECIPQHKTLGIKFQLFDPKAQQLCSPSDFSALREQAQSMIPDSKVSRYSLATTHSWLGLDMREFSDDEASTFVAMDTPQQAEAMERLVAKLVPVLDEIKAVNQAV